MKGRGFDLNATLCAIHPVVMRHMGFSKKNVCIESVARQDCVDAKKLTMTIVLLGTVRVMIEIDFDITKVLL